MAGNADDASSLEEDGVFFTEEAYESFTIQPKFDINLFIAHNPSIKGCNISPVKKRKLSTVLITEKHNDAGGSSAKKAASCSAPDTKTPKLVWNLNSPKGGFLYPRYSCMTHAQQQRYIELRQKHRVWHPNHTRYSMTPEDITEKQQLRKLEMMVHQEQQEFMRFAEHVARCSPRDYDVMPPAALQCAKSQWHFQEQLVKQLPRHFSVCQTVGIVPAAVFPTDPVLTFSAHLLQLGQPHVLEPSSLDSKVSHNLILAFNRCSQHKQATGRETSSRTDKDLSNDDNAVRLAAKYQANIVITTAALATLADNHAPNYDRNWRIPVDIRSSKMADTDSAWKTVFVSDPLTNPYFPHEVSRAFHQKALRDLVTEGSPVTKPPGDQSQTVVADNNTGAALEVDKLYDDYLEHDLTSLETFGSAPVKSHHRKLKGSQAKHIAETTGSHPNPQQWDVNAGNTGVAIPTQGNLVCLPKQDSDQSSPDESFIVPKLSPEKQPNLIPPTSQLFADKLAECFRRESAAKERLTDEAKQCGPDGVTWNDQRETCPRSQFGSPELRPASDSSGAEGELVIALSSDSDSPMKAHQNQSGSNQGITQMQDVGRYNDSEGDDPNMTGLEEEQLHTSIQSAATGKGRVVPVGVEPKEAPTPRRSRRLQRSQPSDISCNTAVPHASVNELEPTVPVTQGNELVAENSVGGENSRSATIPEDLLGGAVLDSPLSPPPHERGLPPSNLPTEKGTLIPEPDSPQLRKQKLISKSAAYSSAPDSKQTPSLRYNLRSKSAGCGNQDQPVDIGTGTVSKELKASGYVCLDQSLPTRKMSPTHEGCPSEIPASQEVFGLHVSEGKHGLGKPVKESMKSTEQDSRNPQRSSALTTHTKPVKQRLASTTSGVESTIDSILKLQQRLHSGKVFNQSPAQPPVSSAVDTMNVPGDACMEKTSDYQVPSDGNADYSLWRFGRHSLLVKSILDAVVLNHADGSQSKTQAVTIVPKMEYQAHFGHEQISVSELTKLWISLLLQPGSKVVQGRVNALTSDLMMLEHFDMNSPLWEQPSFQPSCCMKMMFQILDKLTSLPEDHYLLCHSAGDMHACILQTATSGKKRSLFDLHQSYNQEHMMQSCPPQLLPWLPLDTNLMLPGHITTGRIPATFPPKKPGTTAQGGVTKGASKKKKKKANKKKCGKK